MMVMIVICLLLKNKSLSLQQTKKTLTFQLNFVLEDKFLSNGFGATLSKEGSLNGSEYDS